MVETTDRVYEVQIRFLYSDGQLSHKFHPTGNGTLYFAEDGHIKNLMEKITTIATSKVGMKRIKEAYQKEVKKVEVVNMRIMDDGESYRFSMGRTEPGMGRLRGRWRSLEINNIEKEYKDALDSMEGKTQTSVLEYA